MKFSAILVCETLLNIDMIIVAYDLNAMVFSLTLDQWSGT